jgi:hypothetical protein
VVLGDQTALAVMSLSGTLLVGLLLMLGVPGLLAELVLGFLGAGGAVVGVPGVFFNPPRP